MLIGGEYTCVFIRQILEEDQLRHFIDNNLDLLIEWEDRPITTIILINLEDRTMLTFMLNSLEGSIILLLNIQDRIHRLAILMNNSDLRGLEDCQSILIR